MPKPITVLCWHVIKKIWTEKRMIHISDKCPLGYEYNAIICGTERNKTKHT